ncbi:MAG: hypothetical protein ACLQE9_14160 [Roseiarcus sp.]
MRHEPTANPEIIEQRAGESKLLSRLYREVGLAAVAAELNLQGAALEPDLAEAVERGALLLAPRRSIFVG